MQKLLLMILLLFTVDGLAKAATLNLTTAVERALANNALIRETAAYRQAAEANQRAARADFFPKLAAVYSYTRLAEDPFVVINGTEVIINSLDQHHWDIALNQPLFTGFALSARYRLAQLGLETREMDLQLAELDIVRQVKFAYYNLLLTQKGMVVAEAAVENLRAHESDANKFYQQGIIPLNDLLKSKVALADAVQEQEKTAARAASARAALNLLIDRAYDAATEIEDITQVPPLDGVLPDLMAAALDQRPEIKVVNLAIEGAGENIRLAQSNYYPTIALTGVYQRDGDTLGAPENDFANAYNAGVGLSAQWTFFEAGKTRAQAARYRHEQNALAQKRDQLQDAIRLETQQAYLQLNVAYKNISTAAISRDQAQENWRITHKRYQQQATTATEVLDARTFLTQAETNYYQALYGYLMAQADLDRAVGQR